MTNCVSDIVGCMERKRKSRVIWLVICFNLFLVGVTLIVVGGFKGVQGVADESGRAKKIVEKELEATTTASVGVILLLVSQIVWFIILINMILDKSPVHLAKAIDLRRKA